MNCYDYNLMVFSVLLVAVMYIMGINMNKESSSKTYCMCIYIHVTHETKSMSGILHIMLISVVQLYCKSTSILDNWIFPSSKFPRLPAHVFFTLFPELGVTSYLITTHISDITELLFSGVIILMSLSYITFCNFTMISFRL